jgi:competence protein ComEA
MQHDFSRGARVAGLTALLAALSAAGAAAQSRLPEGPGRELVVRLCSPCHSAEKVVGLQKSRDEWEANVVDMVMNRGAKGTEEEFYEIIEYLARSFPKSPAGDKSATEKINVNKASAKELESSLEISAKESEAIVRLREEKGRFKSLDELEKVPGLDVKKVKAKKDRLEF